MTHSPKVSIILPTHNRAHFIKKSIKSVLAQTYNQYELIIIDDGSTDDTERIIQDIKDERLIYIKHPHQKGANAARNTGIQHAKGEYIAFQDSDDIWSETKLEKQMKAFQQTPSNVGVVYTAFWRVKGCRRKYIPPKSLKIKEGNIFHSLLKKSFIGTPSALIRRECLRKAGWFDENMPRLQDWEFFLRISQHYEFKLIDEPLFTSYTLKDSISRNFYAYIKAIEIIHNEFHEDIVKVPELLHIHNRTLFYYYFRLRKFKESGKYLMKYLKTISFR